MIHDPAAPPRRREDGLTLLEVLAAFMIFSLVFTVLVGSSQRAVTKQGTSFRRLEANEIADAYLADLEVALARRELPVIEEERIEQDPFVIRIGETEVGGRLESDSGSAGPTPEPETAASPIGGLDISSLLVTQAPELAAFARQYEVVVEWPDGNRMRSVRRVAMGVDWPGATSVFAALLPPGAVGPGGDASQPGADGPDGEGPDGGSDRARDGGAADRGGQPSPDEIERMRELIRQKEAELGL